MANDKNLDTYILLPMFFLSIILLLIAIQFNEPSANAYKDLIIITFAFYGIALARGFAAWRGLGSRHDLGKNALLGVGVYVVILVIGATIGVPLAIGTSVVLNLFYRWFSAVIIEAALFRGIIQPTLEKWMGNAFSASIVSSIAWAGFHIVALQGDANQIVTLVIIGVALSMSTKYGNSLVPEIVAHGIWNLKKVLVL